MSEHIKYELRTTIGLDCPFKGSRTFHVFDTGLTATEAVAEADYWQRDSRRSSDVEVSRAGGKLEMVFV